jgi:hypothetical protein
MQYLHQGNTQAFVEMHYLEVKSKYRIHIAFKGITCIKVLHMHWSYFVKR